MKNKAKSSTRHLKIASGILILLAFILGVFIGLIIQSQSEEKVIKINVPFSPSTEGFVEVKSSIQDNFLSYSAGCQALSFGVTQDQAFSIFRGVQNIIDVRPLTHDIIKDILENFGIEVLQVKIDEYNDGIYYSKLLLKQNDKVLDIDLRPSDATAIAVRYGLPIYIKKDILDAYGTNTCEG